MSETRKVKATTKSPVEEKGLMEEHFAQHSVRKSATPFSSFQIPKKKPPPVNTGGK